MAACTSVEKPSTVGTRSRETPSTAPASAAACSTRRSSSGVWNRSIMLPRLSSNADSAYAPQLDTLAVTTWSAVISAAICLPFQPFGIRPLSPPMPTSLPPSPMPSVSTPSRALAWIRISSMAGLKSSISSPRMLFLVPSALRDGSSIAITRSGPTASSSARAGALASPTGTSKTLMLSVGSPISRRMASRIGLLAESTTYVTCLPRRRSARPSSAVPGGPSVSGMPLATEKPVSSMMFSPLSSAAAARWAPSGI
ncbi:hypothetical protein LMG19282_05493 [Cupriavidus campinensis]|nr:hypothetical protein LMG19282_05493 [Cupriavidus campinensis]